MCVKNCVKQNQNQTAFCFSSVWTLYMIPVILMFFQNWLPVMMYARLMFFQSNPSTCLIPDWCFSSLVPLYTTLGRDLLRIKTNVKRIQPPIPEAAVRYLIPQYEQMVGKDPSGLVTVIRKKMDLDNYGLMYSISWKDLYSTRRLCLLTVPVLLTFHFLPRREATRECSASTALCIHQAMLPSYMLF